jgi:hypothetical protein
LKDLVRYSSQLELSGFPSTMTSFKDPLSQYIDNLTSIITDPGLPPISYSNDGNRFGFNNNRTKQLDKYDLEIKPQEFIESSAPFLMPPFDNLP